MTLGFVTFLEGPYKFTNPTDANWGSLNSRLTPTATGAVPVTFSMPNSSLTLTEDCSIEDDNNMSTIYQQITTTAGNPDPDGFPDGTEEASKVLKLSDGTELAAQAPDASIIGWSHARVACNAAGFELCTNQQLVDLRVLNPSDDRMCTCSWSHEGNDEDGGRECSQDSN